MASCSITLALYLTIALESTDFNSTDLASNILKTRHTFVVLISTFYERNKKKEVWVFLKFQKLLLTVSFLISTWERSELFYR